MTRTNTAPDDNQLHEAIADMDALAHEGFAQIAAIAELAMSDLCKHIAQSQSESICAEAGATARHPLRAHRQIRAHDEAKGP